MPVVKKLHRLAKNVGLETPVKREPRTVGLVEQHSSDDVCGECTRLRQGSRRWCNHLGGAAQEEQDMDQVP